MNRRHPAKGILHRLAAALVVATALVVLAIIFAPGRRPACSAERMLAGTSADGGWTPTLCRRRT